MCKRRKVIVVTDGDKNAREAVEVAARKVKARCISSSEGNPTPLSGPKILELIKSAPYDPVVVMVDDKGDCHKGNGERVLEFLSRCDEVEIIGAVAVASHDQDGMGVKVDCSVSQEGKLVSGPVDKTGIPTLGSTSLLRGDTVGILGQIGIPVIIGTGDTGKMNGLDKMERGAPITTRAFEEILVRYIQQP